MENKDQLDKVERFSPSVLNERIGGLKQLFPECFTEGKINFEKLREVLGEGIEEGTERYNFTWAGKRDAIRSLQTPTPATLVPCFEESVDFDNTKTGNIFIKGDNLEVLKLLYKPYFGRVKAIYIDPPYNTGGDFVYPDNYADPLDTYLQLTGQKDGDGNRLTSNVETSGRYHSAWLTMMYPRLFLARQLLQDDGIIFVSIDDHEVHNLRLLMNEVFGEENFVSNIIWQKKYTRSNDARWFSNNHDYLLVFARNKELLQLNLLPRTDDQKATYTNPDNDPRGEWKATPLHAKSGKNDSFEYKFRNKVVWSPPPGTFPRYSRETFAKLDKNNEIWFGKDGTSTPARKTYLSEVKPGITPVTVWLNDEVGNTHEANEELKAILGGGIFDNPKPTDLIKRILELSTSPSEGDIILDFFAGSCTTAEAVLELNKVDGGNRRFMMVQLPEPTPEGSKAQKSGYETIADIGKERIRRVLAKMQEGNLFRESVDLGVRVFKLTESNYRLWNGIKEDTPESYAEQMQLFSDNPLIEGWMPEDVIYEVAIKEGYRLDSLIEQVGGIKRNTIFRVVSADKQQSFFICLDEELCQDELNELGLTTDDLFVCRDQALDDTKAANLALQCRLKTI